MMRRLLAAVVLSVGALSWPGSAQACSCAGPGSPCNAAWQADAVFVGHVVSISSTAGRRVELAVIESFRGLQLSQVTVVTGYGGGDCGYPFEIGQSYFVYVYRTPEGQLSTSICSRTRPLRDATEDLAYARSLAAIAPGTPARVPGRVVLWEYPIPTGGELRPVPRVVVTATGGGLTFSTTANERGEFELTGLPLGTYDVIASAPDGFEATKRTVDIHDPRGCGATQLYIQYDGRVIGRVVDSRGRNVPGLAIELVLADDVDTPGGGRKRVLARTAVDGTFEMRLVAPDRYLLGFNSIRGDRNDRVASLRAFYPGVVERADARTVVVSAGERVHLENFVIPGTIKLATVSGIVVDEAGQPVREARVVLRDDTRVSNMGPAAITGEDGRFAFSLIENGKYDVHVTRYVGTGRNRTAQVSMSRFTATAGNPAITVVVKAVDPYR